jgi:hypothetical protein
MVPLYLQNSKVAVGIFFAVLFLLFMPYALLAYSAIFYDYAQSFSMLFWAALVSSGLLYGACLLDAHALRIKAQYGVCGPIGSLVVVAGFLCGILQAKRNMSVSWRGRSYSMKDHVQNSISV